MRGAALILLILLAACSSAGDQSVLPAGHARLSLSHPHNAPELVTLGAPVHQRTQVTGVSRIVVRLIRSGVELLFDVTGLETTDPATAVPIVMEESNRFRVNLQVRHGDYQVILEALDSSEEVIATGLHAVSVSEDTSAVVPLFSKVGAANLVNISSGRPGEPIDVNLIVRPYAGTQLVVPASDFEVEWLISGGMDDGHVTGAWGVQLQPTDECTPVRVRAIVSRTGDEPTNAVEATLDVDTSSYCLRTDRFISLMNGGQYSCGTTQSQQTACWGINDFGQLGNGSVGHQTAPQPIARHNLEPDESLVQLSGSTDLTCGVSDKHRLYCWGTNLISASMNPVRVSQASLQPGEGFRQVAAGRTHACALTDLFRVVCWGTNTYGQLGDSTYNPSVLPVAVNTAHLQPEERFVSVTAGHHFSCGLTSFGRVHCWGRNMIGQLGWGPVTAGSPTPLPVVSSTLATSERYVAISGGSATTCAVTNLGAIQCWGSNDFGQLGNRILEEALYVTQPSFVESHQLASAAGERFTTVTVGHQHVCATTNFNRVLCWGENESGQLGRDPSSGKNLPAGISTGELAGGEHFTVLSAYDWHSCGITNRQNTYCWGSNFFGSLGFGSPVDMEVPTPTLVVSPTAAR